MHSQTESCGRSPVLHLPSPTLVYLTILLAWPALQVGAFSVEDETLEDSLPPELSLATDYNLDEVGELQLRIEQYLKLQDALDERIDSLKDMMEQLNGRDAQRLLPPTDIRDKRLSRNRGMKRGRLDTLIAKLTRLTGGSRADRVGLMRFGAGK